MIRVKGSAGSGAAGKKARTATPSARRGVEAASTGGRVTPGPAVQAVASGDGPTVVPVTVSLPPALIAAVDDDAHGHRETRSGAFRRLLAKALK